MPKTFDIIDAVSALLLGHEWYMRGRTLDGLTVLDGAQKPTQAEVDAWLAAHNQ